MRPVSRCTRDYRDIDGTTAAGHMLYSSEASLAKFTADLTRFYASDVSGLSAIDERPAG